MTTSSRDYPWPTLAFDNDDYPNSSFAANFEVLEPSGQDMKIRASYSLKCPDLEDLISNEQAKVAIDVRSKGVAKRMLFLFERDEQTIEVPITQSDVTRSIELKPLIIAINPIKHYKPHNAHRFFEGFSFDIPLGGILALGAKTEFSLEEISPSDSIVSVCMVDDSTVAMNVDTSGDKIHIYLKRDMYHTYLFKIASSWRLTTDHAINDHSPRHRRRAHRAGKITRRRQTMENSSRQHP